MIRGFLADFFWLCHLLARSYEQLAQAFTCIVIQINVGLATRLLGLQEINNGFNRETHPRVLGFS